MILDLSLDGLRNLKILDLLYVYLNEDAFLKFLNRTGNLEDLRVNGCSVLGDGFFFRLRELKKLKRLTVNHFQQVSDNQLQLMRKNISKLRAHLGFYDITHLSLYECPAFLRDCYNESEKLDILVSLKFGSIESGKEE